MNTVDLFLMVIAYISMFNCIVRSDYNLVTALVCYFYWNSRQSKIKRISNIIYLVLFVTSIFDLIWLFVVWSKWTSSENMSIIWSQLRPWHITVLITSLVNIGLKAASIWFVYIENKNEHPYNQLKNVIEDKEQALY